MTSNMTFEKPILSTHDSNAIQGMYVNVRDFGDAGGSLGKRCLFFLTASYPEIRLLGDRVKQRVKHLVFRGARCALNCP